MSDNEEIPVDDLVTVSCPLFRQLLNAYSEDAATDDYIYYLGEALRQASDIPFIVHCSVIPIRMLHNGLSARSSVRSARSARCARKIVRLCWGEGERQKYNHSIKGCVNLPRGKGTVRR